jgi:hypothetical protein
MMKSKLSIRKKKTLKKLINRKQLRPEVLYSKWDDLHSIGDCIGFVNKVRNKSNLNLYHIKKK